MRDDRFFREVASGLALLAEHVEALEESARILADQELWRGLSAIRLVADEEAAKFLIILDAVRCPTSMDAERVTQLKRSHDHISKGLYVELCDMRPADFAEVIRLVDGMRETYYLDGPSDVDWIFRNQIEARREELLYVDYVEDEGGCRWLSPGHRDEFAVFDTERSTASKLLSALARAGGTDARGLKAIAKLWRPFTPEPSTRWSAVDALSRETVEALQSTGASDAKFTDQDAATIVRSWPFPMYGIKLEPLVVDRKKLRQR